MPSNVLENKAEEARQDSAMPHRLVELLDIPLVQEVDVDDRAVGPTLDGAGDVRETEPVVSKSRLRW